MTDDSALRHVIKRCLDRARGRIAAYTGLYPDEDLMSDVLRACHEAAAKDTKNQSLEDARHAVETRCLHLVQAADRFAVRDLATIAAARARAVAAVDTFQDAALEARRAGDVRQRPGSLLKKRAL